MSKMKNSKEHTTWIKQLIAEEIEKYLKNKEAKERAKMEKMTAGFRPKKTTWINA